MTTNIILLLEEVSIAFRRVVLALIIVKVQSPVEVNAYVLRYDRCDLAMMLSVMLMMD